MLYMMFYQMKIKKYFKCFSGTTRILIINYIKCVYDDVIYDVI